jgi:hypothetical protein
VAEFALTFISGTPLEILMRSAEGVEEKLIEVLNDMSPERVWDLSSELSALKASVGLKRGKGSVQLVEALDESLDVAGDFHEFSVEMRSEIESRDFSQMASIFDLTAIGTLAAQDILPHLDEISLPKILLGALSEGLIFLGSRQYVAGAQKIVNARLRIHSLKVYRRLWELPMDFKTHFTEKDVGRLQESLEKFFAELLREDVPPPSKIAVLLQFYTLILAIQIEKTIRALG